jgi:hypothetical protein
MLLFTDDQILIQDSQTKLKQSIYDLHNIGKMLDMEISFKEIKSYGIQRQVYDQG